MGVYRIRLDDSGDPVFLPVVISIPADSVATRRQLVGPLRNTVSTRLVLDSGSRLSCLSYPVLEPLNAPCAGPLRLQTAAGTRMVDRFRVRLEFPPGTLKPIPDVTVARIQMPAKLSTYGGVIGRDILDQWEFFWSGFRRRLATRDYPSFWGWLLS